MATVMLELTQVKTSVDGGFSVENSITDFANIEAEVFLFKKGETEELDSYYAVCEVHDMNAYPNERDPDLAYYRKDIATKVFDVVTQAITHEESVRVAVSRLVVDYQVYVDSFEGTVVNVYTGA